MMQVHAHTGQTMVVTRAGRWHYLEYPAVNTAGSYVFEPAGATHASFVPPDIDEITIIWFAIRGSNLNLDNKGGSSPWTSQRPRTLPTHGGANVPGIRRRWPA